MKKFDFVKYFFTSIILLGCCFYTNAQQKKVLFIGNSFTYYSDRDANKPELPISFNGIAKNVYPVDNLSYTLGDHAIQGGQSLEGHYNDGKALAKIRQGGWEYVVLQEQSLRPYDNPEQYFKYVRLFDAEIKAKGGKTVIYMTWAYKNDWYKFPTYVNNFEKIAKEIGAIVVPCGKAWETARTENPAFNLYDPDTVHPSPEGSYLNACVFFATLSGRNPEETSYIPYLFPISTDNIQYARSHAWQTVQNYVQPAFNQPQNLLVNPGFEDGQTGWMFWGWPSVSYYNQRSGNICDSIQTAWDGDCQNIASGFNVGDNMSYSAWFKFKGAGTGGGNILYQCLDEDYNEITFGYTDIPSEINNNYTQYSVDFIVPQNTKSISLSFGNNSNTQMFIDDASLINYSTNQSNIYSKNVKRLPNKNSNITGPSAKIVVSPNPFTSRFSVALFSPKADNFTINIYEITGKLVATKKVVTNQQVLSFNAFANKGMYIIKVTNSKNEVITEKVVQQ
jgi:Secretion system C-terminal sorting domain